MKTTTDMKVPSEMKMALKGRQYVFCLYSASLGDALTIAAMRPFLVLYLALDKTTVIKLFKDLPPTGLW